MAAEDNPISTAVSPPPGDGPTTYTQDPLIGALLKDRYLIERELKRGGIGIVYLARDTELLSKYVVIKILLEQMLDTEHRDWVQKKFRQEIEALARLNHPGVVGVLDTGHLPDGRSYFVMQYVEGVNLRSLMPERGMDFDRTAGIVRQMCQALSAAHDRGVIHRDLKPENILVQNVAEGEDHVTIVDFGIATVKDSQTAVNSRTTKIAGTIPYMAPEQLKGKPSVASDIYALGVISYEMLTGQTPFKPNTPLQLYEMQRSGVIVRPKSLRTGIPEAAQTVILKALAFDAQERHSRVRDFGEQLALALITRNQPSAGMAGTMVADLDPSPSPEMAHVLYIGIIEYWAHPDREQSSQQLAEIVSDALKYRRPPERDYLLLPTSDGLALTFFHDPEALVHCAQDIIRGAQKQKMMKLRMGIGCGLVARAGTINDNLNLNGGGINLAHWVMSFGDAGHILLAHNVVEALHQSGNLQEQLQQFETREFVPGTKIQLFQLVAGAIGGAQNPETLRQIAPSTNAFDSSGKSSLPEKEAGETTKASKRASPLMLKAIFGLGVLALIAASLLVAPRVTSWLTSSPPPAQAPADLPVTGPEHVVSYGMIVQRYRNGRPFGKPFPFLPSSRMLFEKDYEIQMNVTSPEDGYFYLINQGTAAADGGIGYNVVYPVMMKNRGSALLPANQQIRIEMSFDQKEGTETLWLIWARQMVPELEAAKGWANPTDRGQIKDADQLGAVRQFLSTHSSADPKDLPQASNDEERKLMNVRGRQNIFVNRIQLEHQ